jgi:hypothetical protein
MKVPFLLAILLLAACTTEAKGRPSNQNDAQLQLQTSSGDFGNETEKPFELVLLLGAMAFPVTLICSYELCRSMRVRQPISFGSFFPLRPANASQAGRHMAMFPRFGSVRIL